MEQANHFPKLFVKERGGGTQRTNPIQMASLRTTVVCHQQQQQQQH